MFPVVALSLSTWLEGYHWSPLALLGFALVLAGNLLVLTRRRAVPTILPKTVQPT
jgi:drug/metabolite transporter (DMT)-like permease